MIYNPEIVLSQKNYIHTSTGNIVSRRATICRPQTVEIPNGRCFIGHDVIIRGDLAPVQLNRYSHIGARTVLHPGYTSTSQGFKFIPLTVGSHCRIADDCVVEAAVMGVGCIVEKNCVLSKRCILKDFVKVLEGSVVPPDMVVPPFSIVAGVPAKIIGEQPESTSTLGTKAAEDYYRAHKVMKS